MHTAFENRTAEFQRRLIDDGIDVALIHDEDNIYYLTAYWGYLGMQFGRPTLAVVPSTGDCTVITPGLEAEMARAMTWVTDVREWSDGIDNEWRRHLEDLFSGRGTLTLGVEALKTHPVVLDYLRRDLPHVTVRDITPILDDMRMVKTPEEIETMRQAGQVAVAMCRGGKDAIAAGVPEYEIALAVIQAGTRKAAEYLTDRGLDRFYSPMIYSLQVLQSGRDLCMVHRRPNVRRVQSGEPVYMCFCEMNDFKHFKLGFDRMYFVDGVTDEQARLYETSLAAQSAALKAIRPGAVAEEVNAAALAVYQEAGHGPCYRTGRGVGFSYLERPELKQGDRTVLQTGMTFAVDGGITVPGEFGARVGDSIVVTDDGYDVLTPYPKELCVL